MNRMAPFGEQEAPYEAVFGDVSNIIDAARESAARSVNAAMTAAYWLIGHRIVEFEQSGEERAEYGTARSPNLPHHTGRREGVGRLTVPATSRRWFCLPYTLVGQSLPNCELFGGRSGCRADAIEPALAASSQRPPFRENLRLF